MRTSSPWRNPPWPLRVVIVALATTMPGALLGASAALFFGDFEFCLTIGGLIGMLIGMTLEAPGQDSSPDDDDYKSGHHKTGREHD